MLGECKFCGQTMIVEDAVGQQEANDYASKNCTCDVGRKYRNIEDIKAEAKMNVRALIELEYEAEFENEPAIKRNKNQINLIDLIIDKMAEDTTPRVTVKISETTTVVLVRKADGGIEVEKKYKHNDKLSTKTCC